MKKTVFSKIALFAALGTPLLAHGHGQGHGPTVDKIGAAGEVFSSAVLVKDADLGAKADQKFIARFIALSGNKFSLTLLDSTFKAVVDPTSVNLPIKLIEIPLDQSEKPVIGRVELPLGRIQLETTLARDKIATLEVIFEWNQNKYVAVLTRDQLQKWSKEKSKKGNQNHEK